MLLSFHIFQLQKINWKREEVDLYELNEAFAAQSLAVLQDLQLDARLHLVTLLAANNTISKIRIYLLLNSQVNNTCSLPIQNV